MMMTIKFIKELPLLRITEHFKRNRCLFEAFLGRLVVADIGIPEVCADDEDWARMTLR